VGEVKTYFSLVAVLFVASAHAAPTEWLEGTVLADCRYCKTDAFGAERRQVANQSGPAHDPSSGMGYVVTLDGERRFVWGRAALIGTGSLIRTDAHVLYADTGRLKNAAGTVYFEPMRHEGVDNLIEIDLSSVQRGGAVGPLETDVKNDWAIARLKEDAIAKFAGDRVFAFLWDLRATHDQMVKHDYLRASVLVLSHEHTLDIHRSCQSVTDDHPSLYAFGVEEIMFIRCPSEHLQAGSSGSTLAIPSTDGTWNLGGQVIARGIGQTEASEGTGPSAWAQQLLLGNVPEFKQTVAIVYLQELIRRGMDPRGR
jgi:hypothetical protein